MPERIRRGKDGIRGGETEAYNRAFNQERGSACGNSLVKERERQTVGRGGAEGARVTGGRKRLTRRIHIKKIVKRYRSWELMT